MMVSPGEKQLHGQRLLKGVALGSVAPGDAGELYSAMALEPGLWVRFLEKTSLAPVFHHRVKSAGMTGKLPGEIAGAAEAEYKLSTGRNIVRQEELFRLAEIFHERGIPLAPLKGAWLLKRVYSPIGARPMSDTDLLVPRSRFLDAVRLLETSGYRNRLGFLRGNPPPYPCGIQFVCESGPPHILELHWEIVNTFEIKSRVIPPGAVRRLRSDLYRSLVPLEWEGRRMYALPDEFTLISLMYHHFSHSFADGIWFLDFLLMLRSAGDSVDPYEFAEKVFNYGMGKIALMYFERCAAEWPETAESGAFHRAMRERCPAKVRTPAAGEPFRQWAAIASPGAFACLAANSVFVKKSYFETVNGRLLSVPEYISCYVKHLLKIKGLAIRGDDRYLVETPRCDGD